MRWLVGLLLVAFLRAATAAVSSQLGIRSFAGEDLFRFYCANCHGASAKGDGPLALKLKTMPADLTRIAERNGGTFPRERIEQFITYGDPSTLAHGEPDMPVWGEIFLGLDPSSDRRVKLRIESLVRYVESLQVRGSAISDRE
jgi:mono/diheme cytochrome c family protein